MPNPCSKRCPKHKIGWETFEEIATRSFSKIDLPELVGSRISTSLVPSTGIGRPWASQSRVPLPLVGTPASMREIGKTDASAPESKRIVVKPSSSEISSSQNNHHRHDPQCCSTTHALNHHEKHLKSNQKPNHLQCLRQFGQLDTESTEIAAVHAVPVETHWKPV